MKNIIIIGMNIFNYIYFSFFHETKHYKRNNFKYVTYVFLDFLYLILTRDILKDFH